MRVTVGSGLKKTPAQGIGAGHCDVPHRRRDGLQRLGQAVTHASRADVELQPSRKGLECLCRCLPHALFHQVT